MYDPLEGLKLVFLLRGIVIKIHVIQELPK